MNTIEELDTYVQTTLKDHSMSPWRRAKEAARAIRAQVMAEEGLDPGTPLPIPIEWEHRVSGLASEKEWDFNEVAWAAESPSPLVEIDGAKVSGAKIIGINLLPGPPDPSKGVHEIILDGEGSHDEVAAELMKEAFDAEFIGDEDLAQQWFDKFWGRDS